MATEKRAVWRFMEKQVILRTLSGTGSHWPDGERGRAARHGIGFKGSSPVVLNRALFAPTITTE